MPSKVRSGFAFLLLLGCDERERLTFSTDPEDRVGPVSTIDPPSSDTTLTEGDLFVLGGRTIDPSGVDSIYFELEGANLSYLPIDGEGEDTVTFGLSLPTIGIAGRTITVRVFGVDLIGNRGATVARRLTIQ